MRFLRYGGVDQNEASARGPDHGPMSVLDLGFKHGKRCSYAVFVPKRNLVRHECRSLGC